MREPHVAIARPAVLVGPTNQRNRDSDAWFFVPDPRPDARLRLFCFPYAGGWPWAFRSWSAILPGDVEVCTVCLPGRGRRAREPQMPDFDSLVRALCYAMTERLDRPYALFGHSLGALVAFEVAGALARQEARQPLRLFVSGCSAPGRRRSRRTLHRLSDAELVEQIRALNGTPASVLEDPEMLAMTLPLLRADFALGETHQLQTDTLDCPMTALFGVSDADVTRDAAAEWGRHAAGQFVLRGFPGDHFFLHSQTRDVLAALQKDLL